jgi:putative proteasome-type protease
MQFYERDSLTKGYEKRVEATDPYYRSISEGWSDALRSAFNSLPDFKRD